MADGNFNYAVQASVNIIQLRPGNPNSLLRDLALGYVAEHSSFKVQYISLGWVL